MNFLEKTEKFSVGDTLTYQFDCLSRVEKSNNSTALVKFEENK